MKARYIGNPTRDDDGPRRVGFAGKSFPRGVFIDVTDVAAKLIAKLETNPYFETSEAALTKEDVAAAEAVNGPPEDETPAGAAGAIPEGKAGLIAALEAMQAKHPEVTFSPKWSAAKLQAALEAARFEHGDDED